MAATPAQLTAQIPQRLQLVGPDQNHQRPGLLRQELQTIHLILQPPPSCDFGYMLRLVDQQRAWLAMAQRLFHCLSQFMLLQMAVIDDLSETITIDADRSLVRALREEWLLEFLQRPPVKITPGEMTGVGGNRIYSHHCQMAFLMAATAFFFQPRFQMPP